MSSFSQINTNIQSQRAFQNLSETSEELQTRQQRLTTGLRINSAEDDAAGFEIANQLEAKTRGQSQALRNIGDGKSTLSTAEGALDSQLEILQTAKEKATQAANGSLSKSERESIQGELDQLTKELQDIAKNAEFNGQSLLTGASGGGEKDFTFQTGAGADNQFGVSLGDSKATALTGNDLDGNTTAIGNNTSNVTNADNLSFNEEGVAGLSLQSSAGGGNVQLQNGSGTALENITGGSGNVIANSDGELKNLEGGEFNLEISLADDPTSEAQSDGSGNEVTSGGDDGTGESFKVTVNGNDSNAQFLTASTTQPGLDGSGNTQKGDLDTISNVSGPSETNDGDFTNIGGAKSSEGGLDNTDTSKITLEEDTTSGDKLELSFDGADASDLKQAIDNADGSSVETSVKVGGDGVEFNPDVTETTDNEATGAQNAINVIDGAIDQVAGELSDLGAAQNRLSFKESNLETSRTNLNAAQSRIEDADFAREQTQVAKLQVQQQSGTAQLAQANAAGQSVLSLLQ